MYLYSKLQNLNKPIRIAFIGCGKFVSMFLAQYNQLNKIIIDSIIELDIDRAKKNCLNSGLGSESIKKINFSNTLDEILDRNIGTKALRSGILLSSYNKNEKINLIDFFQAYPNKNIAIDLNALSKTLKKVKSLKELIEFYSNSPFKKLKDGSSSN